MKYAILENDIVVNCVVCDSENEHLLTEQGLTVIQSDDAHIGDSFIDGEFVKPIIEDVSVESDKT